MSVDTKGFLLSDCKDVMLIMGLISQAFQGLIRAECQTVFGDAGLKRSAKAREMFVSPEMDLKPDMGMVLISFTFHGERRSMHVFFDCDCDRVKYGPQSISMTLGCWGYSDLFMKTALQALSLLGPVYFDSNDSDDIDFELLDEKTLPVLGAVNLDYIKDSRFPDWVELYDAGKVGVGQNFDEFFGAPEAVVREICGIEDFTARWHAVVKLANSVVAMPSFLAEYHQDAIAKVELAKEAAEIAAAAAAEAAALAAEPVA
jgi:hypothetical protein